MLSFAPTVALSLALLASPVSQAVELPTDTAPLHGTLTRPDGPVRAAAVIIAGSGPTDRNGDSVLGVRGSVFRSLAEGLAERGIASVRIDKRGVGQSLAAATSESELRFSTYTTDAANWAEKTANDLGLPCVWFIGHSEGALVAQVASQDNAKICGLVLLSPAGTTAEEELARQFGSISDTTVRDEALRIIRELAAGRTVENTPPHLAAAFRPSVQPYLISWFPLDPQALIATETRPVFIGHGTHDIQVSPDNAEKLKAAQPNATLVMFDGLNHVLKPSPSDLPGNGATYGNAAIGLGDEVVPAVADFILAH